MSAIKHSFQSAEWTTVRATEYTTECCPYIPTIGTTQRCSEYTTHQSTQCPAQCSTSECSKHTTHCTTEYSTIRAAGRSTFLTANYSA